jgi:hypothetical protein
VQARIEANGIAGASLFAHAAEDTLEKVNVEALRHLLITDVWMLCGLDSDTVGGTMGGT